MISIQVKHNLSFLQLEIYDVVGSLLQSKIGNLQSEIEIDISHLASGLYFLKVSNTKVIYTSFQNGSKKYICKHKWI